MSQYSYQAVPDVRFCNNEGDDGGDAVSGTASSSEQERFDSNPVLRPRNAKTTKISTNNSIVSDGGGIHNKNVPQQGHANKPSSKYSINWKKKRQQLADFKREFRHTNVPQKYEKNRQLGIWVHNQRKQYRLYKAKKKRFP